MKAASRRSVSALALAMCAVCCVASPAIAAAFREQPVWFRNGPVTLAGSLLLPDGGGTHSAVVMQAGSGPKTREATRDRGSFLARHGIAALIYDKRGTGQSTGHYPTGTADFGILASDLVAGVDLVRREPGIDPQHVGVWGSSEGGYVAPLAASRSSTIAFVVASSAPGGKGFSVEMWDVEGGMRRARFPTSAIAFQMRAMTVVDRAKLELGDVPKVSWNTDPASFWRKVRQPVLLAYGKRDIAIPPAASARRIAAALTQGDNPDYTIIEFPQAGHGLMVGTHGPGPMSVYVPGYLRTVLQWIRAHAPARRGRSADISSVWRPREIERLRSLSGRPWFETPFLQLLVTALFLVGFLATVGGASVRFFRKPRRSSASAASVLTATAGGLNILIVAGACAFPAVTWTDTPADTTLWSLLRVSAILSAALAAAVALTTYRGRAEVRPVRGLGAASLCVLFVPFLVYWHLLG